MMVGLLEMHSVLCLVSRCIFDLIENILTRVLV